MAESAIHISLTAEPVIHIGENFAITNSLLTSWIAILLLLVFALLATRKMKTVPGNLQQIAEIIVDGIYGLFATILKDNIGKYFPLLATFFIYIITLNWQI